MSGKSVINKDDLHGQSSMDGTVKVTFNDNIAIISMLCGENRLNINFINKLHNALDEVLRNENICALITTSDGKIYSNGLDLDWLATIMSNPEKHKSFMMDYVRVLFRRIATFPIPTIAALNGHAFAGGFMLALCHDYIVMSSSRGWVCLNEVHLGMLFTPFMRNIIIAKLPTGTATHQAMVLGRRFTAQEALDLGIVQRICPREELLQTATNLGKSLVAKAPYNRKSLESMKKDIYGDCFTTETLASQL